MAVITVIGSGAMGSAMSFPARANGHEVRLVGTMLDRAIIDELRKSGFHSNLKRHLPKGVKFFQLEEMENALNGADLAIGGVSSFGVEWFCNEVLPKLPKGLPVLSITKGLRDEADGSLTPFPHIYEVADSERSFCAVGGPCTSYELADGDQTQVCFCGRDAQMLRWMRELLATDNYHISISTDVMGVECAVALKNAYALGVTLAVGLSEKRDGKMHYNSQAALFGQSIREMRGLLRLFGGGDDNIVYGAGDLYVTIYGGRTRRIGTLLGKGLTFAEAMRELSGVTLESTVIIERTARALRVKIAKGSARAEDYPLILHIDDIITREAAVNIPWKAFLVDSI